MADRTVEDLQRLQGQLRQEARDIRSAIPSRVDELRRTLEAQASEVEKRANELDPQIKKLQEIQRDIEGPGSAGRGLFG